MKKVVKCIAIVLLILFVLSFCLYKISRSRTFQFFGEIVHRVDTDQRVVALTFDDGPTPHTNEVLQMLDEGGVNATFYVTGQELEEYPEIGQAIVDSGNELGNHSYSHQRFLFKSQDFIEQEIQSTNVLIQATGYEGDITFRPPYSKKLLGLPWYLMRNDITTVMVDVEPDSYGLDTDFIVDHTVQNVENGSIILLHPFCDSCTGQREAIPMIIQQLQADGFTFVTVSELLSIND